MKIKNRFPETAMIIKSAGIQLFLIFLISGVFGQTPLDSILSDEKIRNVEFKTSKIELAGKVHPVMIIGGDTLILAYLEDVRISSPRAFSNREDYIRYRRYKAYAAKVYPYAKEAIRIFREMEYATKHMKKKDRKKYIKTLQKELEQEFEIPLKKLSKTQGKILVEMIERELDTSLYDLIKKLNGRFKAFYWNQFSKLHGYRIKWPYKEGENPILDAVLQDLDISHQVEEDISKQK